MRKLFQSLLLLFTRAEESELARQVQFLKTENEILRSKLPRRITITAGERQRLLQFGKPLGAAIKLLISIVSPRTFLGWIRQQNQPAEQKAARQRGPGRPPTDEEVRALILRMARENAWGYTRILGELKKIGVKVSRSTVRNILKEAGIDPGPRRGEGSWTEFVNRHAQTLWACDFFTQKVATLRGTVEIFVLFFIHIGSRRVHIAGMTPNPDRAWMVQQGRNTALVFAEQSEAPRYLIRDNDTKFVAEFDAILEDEGVEVLRIPPCTPNMNPYAERFVGSIRAECLDHFVFFGEGHLRYVVSEWVSDYQTRRLHQGVGNVPLTDESVPEPSPISVDEVVCEERLGGLLKHYRRAG